MATTLTIESGTKRTASVPIAGKTLSAGVYHPRKARGAVIFVQTGGDRECTRQNESIAGALAGTGMAGIILELLSNEEKCVYERYGNVWFDTRLLARRLATAACWLREESEWKGLDVGCFGSTLDAPVILVAASENPMLLRASVLLSPQSGLAASAIPALKTPTMFVVSAGNNAEVSVNREAFNRCQADKKLVLLPEHRHRRGGTGTLQAITALSREWFARYLGKAD